MTFTKFLSVAGLLAAEELALRTGQQQLPSKCQQRKRAGNRHIQSRKLGGTCANRWGKTILCKTLLFQGALSSQRSLYAMLVLFIHIKPGNEMVPRAT